MKFDVKDELKLKRLMPNKNSIESMSKFFHAFSDVTRLKIIMLLSLKSLCVSEITQVLNINQTTISHQLQTLRSLNIVSCDRVGKKVVYYIKNSEIENVLNVSVDCVWFFKKTFKNLLKNMKNILK